MLLRQGKHSLEHLGDKYQVKGKRGERNLIFNEMVKLFKDDETEKPPEKNKSNQLHELFHYNPFKHEMDEDERINYKDTDKKINNLFESRIKDKDNTFLVITEMDGFEK